jgi:NAD(P)-dependent dehydrogenase (short-subunit alcohol dehydrogenase family)
MGPSPLFDLSGRTALVTGSSAGLGFAMAAGLAGAGARLVLNGRDGARLEAAAHDVAKAGHSVSTLPFDVVDETAIQAAFDRLDRDGIAVDILGIVTLAREERERTIKGADFHAAATTSRHVVIAAARSTRCD